MQNLKRELVPTKKVLVAAFVTNYPNKEIFGLDTNFALNYLRSRGNQEELKSFDITQTLKAMQLRDKIYVTRDKSKMIGYLSLPKIGNYKEKVWVFLRNEADSNMEKIMIREQEEMIIDLNN